MHKATRYVGGKRNKRAYSLICFVAFPFSRVRRCRCREMRLDPFCNNADQGPGAKRTVTIHGIHRCPSSFLPSLWKFTSHHFPVLASILGCVMMYRLARQQPRKWPSEPFTETYSQFYCAKRRDHRYCFCCYARRQGLPESVKPDVDNTSGTSNSPRRCWR